MTAHRNDGASAPRASRPTNGEAPAGGAAQGLQGQAQQVSLDSRAGSYGEQARRAIEGEQKASAYLARLHAEQADPDELAVIVSMLYGAALRGFCRVIEKLLRGGAS